MAEQPIPVTIESALAADHAALPWVVGPPAGPTGAIVPPTSQKTLVRLQLSAVAGVTMNVLIYGRDRWTHTSHLLTTITNLQGYTDGTTAYEVQNPERYDRIAIYVNGATWAGKTLNASMICSAMPGAGDSAAATATAASVASIDAKTPALGSALTSASSPSTIATDDPHMGAVGAASDVDGVVHGQLRYTGEATEASRALLATIDADTGAISTVEGTTADAAVTTDAAGTISAKLRGWIVLLLSYLATVGAAVKTYGLSIVVSDGTNARLLLGDTSGQAKTRPPSPGDAETITAILGADPVTAEMVAIDLDTVFVTVQGSVVANAGTNNRIVLYGEPRDTGPIAAISAADFTVMETNGPFRVGIKPEPVGMLYKKIGARKYFTDGGDDPVFTIIMRQRK